MRTDAVVLRNSRTYAPYDEERLEVCLESGSPEEEYELTLFDEVVRAAVAVTVTMPLFVCFQISIFALKQ